MASGRRQQHDEPDLAFVAVEVSFYVSDVGRIIKAASELKSSQACESENKSSDNTDLDIGSFSHIHLNNKLVPQPLEDNTQPSRKNKTRSSHREAV
jgi:hypothetical protein